MIEREKKRLCIVTLLFLLCFAVLQIYAEQSISAFVILGGALLLLFYKKRKWWAFWCYFVLFFIWGTHTELPFVSKHIFGTILTLLGGCFLLYQYYETGWESYVTPGCFLIAFGLFGMTARMTFFEENIVVLFFVCLTMVWYSSSNIKKRKKTIIRVWLESLAVFALLLVVLML